MGSFCWGRGPDLGCPFEEISRTVMTHKAQIARPADSQTAYVTRSAESTSKSTVPYTLNPTS